MQNHTPNIHNSDFIIFGGTGDLAKRKLFPALYNNYTNREENQISSRIIGICRIKMTVESYRSFVDKELQRYLKDGEYNPLKVQKFLSLIDRKSTLLY